MNAFAKRISLAVVSVAIAGGAALGTAGVASAAPTAPSEHGRVSTSGFQGGEGRAEAEADRGGHFREYRTERGDHREDSRGRYSASDRRDDRRFETTDRDHRGRTGQDRDHHYDRNWNQVELEYRWDGHHLYRLVDGRWVDVTPYRHGVVDHWYVDQLIAAQR
ncbi:hypothetical protein [Streptomyces sp. WAC 04229]|uniref:hypothetical protein n=1 Tax=Streptomyces sp. WAC 04229 TaxID=2203206 RepID=UPI003D709162